MRGASLNINQPGCVTGVSMVITVRATVTLSEKIDKPHVRKKWTEKNYKNSHQIIFTKPSKKKLMTPERQNKRFLRFLNKRWIKMAAQSLPCFPA